MGLRPSRAPVPGPGRREQDQRGTSCRQPPPASPVGRSPGISAPSFMSDRWRPCFGHKRRTVPVERERHSRRSREGRRDVEGN
ncbi:hypothetical protein MPTK1_7g17430 [Marchantia polymorpha subsp. ruderalis]|uniref:Uncharacterized protein n=2 Tax=Marchantia polymorpha TaxID=3197 RepID=A0AAF6C0S0_MARPO|nr:hypothetical protein MARPO_0051s0080 [Marchantia polymorpha]BBN17854.1 hypothetical protein Mp_7g17430 [Marchantia polymorpha subsp. ruderalis]|eukprot:PTQ38479.1 hypothetical protein MARPO_0051s0080 [Marchantia polymorpha]